MAYMNILGFFGHEWITKAHADGIGITLNFEIERASMDQLERLANHIELAETQDFDFIPELEEN